MTAKRLAILLSGRGSNFGALLDAQRTGSLNAEFVGVISNRRHALGLRRAREADIPAQYISHRRFSTREDFELAMLQQLSAWRVDFVILAGFMRVLTPTFIDAYRQRLINIHPSLLPAFPGIDAQKQAFDHGVKLSGCTVHFVDAGTDTGPIIAQCSINIDDCVDAAQVSARILQVEHRLFPEAIAKILATKWRIRGRRVIFD